MVAARKCVGDYTFDLVACLLVFFQNDGNAGTGLDGGVGRDGLVLWSRTRWSCVVAVPVWSASSSCLASAAASGVHVLLVVNRICGGGALEMEMRFVMFWRWSRKSCRNYCVS